VIVATILWWNYSTAKSLQIIQLENRVRTHTTFDPIRLNRLYTFLSADVDRGDLPGAAVQLSQRGEALPARAFGRFAPAADAQPMQPDSIFLVASITKPVVVSAVMLLAERGELLLDEPASSFVPEFSVNGKEAITLRHLMTHTSGLPDMLPENQALREAHAPMEEFIRRICDLTPDFPAGTGIQYQSAGIAILGEIVQRVSGLPLRDFLRQEIFDPLGMHDTALGVVGLPKDRLSQVNVLTEQIGTDWGWNSDYWRTLGAAWGGMFSTVGDLTHYLQAILNGGELDGVRVFSRATVAAMLRDQTTPMPGIPAEQKAVHGWGLGWRLAPATGWRYFGDLLTPGSFGHGGATGTVCWADPAQETTFVLLTTQPAAWSEPLLGRASNLAAASVL
jgi:CubicO group peptidase (beta-lactamase class C family)